MNTWFKNNFNSTKFRVTTTIITLLLLLLVGVAVAQTLKTNVPVITPKDDLTEQIEKSPDFSLTIEQDEDAPMKILEAKVKEISLTDYEKLTSEKSDLQKIISVPEVKMVNVSDKIITGVTLIIDDKTAEVGKGIYIKGQNINPGEAFNISRAGFVKLEQNTSVDESGNITTINKNPMKNSNFWLAFSDKNRLKVRAFVEFSDGTKWFNREKGGETK
ncbi:MAG TPA: hypothetical protein PKE69_19240 [Pyrinomonadaceae bacterium]|nr:hypothetical protein [Pyrinomonadaceae bacterium]